MSSLCMPNRASVLDVFNTAVHHAPPVLHEVLCRDTSPENRNRMLAQAASLGMVDAVRVLLPIANPLWESSQALVKAAAGGHEACVKLLWSSSHVPSAFQQAIRSRLWRAADRLACGVLAAHWMHAEQLAPKGSLPRIHAWLERLALEQGVDAPAIAIHRHRV